MFVHRNSYKRVFVRGGVANSHGRICFGRSKADSFHAIPVATSISMCCIFPKANLILTKILIMMQEFHYLCGAVKLCTSRRLYAIVGANASSSWCSRHSIVHARTLHACCIVIALHGPTWYHC